MPAVAVQADPAGNLYISEFSSPAKLRLINASSSIISTLNPSPTTVLSNSAQSFATSRPDPVWGLGYDVRGYMVFSERDANRVAVYDVARKTGYVVAGSGVQGKARNALP